MSFSYRPGRFPGRFQQLYCNGATYLSLSLFRVLLYGVICGELIEIALQRSVIVKPGLVPTVLLAGALLASTSALVGNFTRVSAAVTFLCFRPLRWYLLAGYDVDAIIVFFSLLFALAPPQKALSVDSLRARNGQRYWSEEIPSSFVIAVTVAMTLIYLDAIWTKLGSASWRNGTALWLAMYLPPFASWRLPGDSAALYPVFQVAAYAVTLYEALFPLILLRPLRKVFVVSGCALHAGIAVLMPLKYFGLVMTAPLLMYLGVFQRERKGGAPARSPELRLGPLVITYRALMTAYCLFFIASFTHAVLAGNWNPAARALGYPTAGVFADEVFTTERPLLRLTLQGPEGLAPFPSFDEEGYPTLRDRHWKVFGFFLRWSSCPRDFLLRHVESHASLCPEGPCEVVVYGKKVAARLEFSTSQVPMLKREPWTRLGVVRWSEPVSDEQRLRWIPDGSDALAGECRPAP
jgi:hypothetical protein